MEHLLTEGITPFFRVPVSTVSPYSSGEHLTHSAYDQTLAAVRRLHDEDPTANHVAIWSLYLARDSLPHLRAWLLEECLFARLRLIFPDKPYRQDFVAKLNDGREVLTTVKLEDYLRSWQVRMQRMPEGEVTKVHGLANRDYRILTSLDHSLHHAYSETAVFGDTVEVDELGKLHYALVLFHLAFEGVRGASFVRSDSAKTRKQLLASSPKAWIRRELAKAGWCPYTARKLLNESDASVIAYAFAIGTERTAQSHGSCSEMACMANRAPDDAPLRHIEGGCNCKIVEAPMRKIAQIIRGGGVPILQVSVDRLGLVSMKALPKSDGHPYVAVSHVWADGLGSPTSNTIATCQLQLLKKHLPKQDSRGMSGTSSPMGLWIDTLCIPVDPSLQSLRNSQVAKMRSVYRSARAVLVLDHDLLRLSRNNASPLAITTSVSLAAWSMRLWTYQESALNDHLLLLTSTGTIDFDNACRAAVSGNPSIDRIALRPLRQTTVQTALALGRANRIWPRHTGWHPRQTLWALSDRSASRAADETLVIAAFFNLSVTSIFESRTEEGRMIALLRAFDRIPADLPFTLGPRLRTKGFRWAPASLLRSRGASMRTPPRNLTLPSSSPYPDNGSMALPDRSRIRTFGTSSQIPMGAAPAAATPAAPDPAACLASDNTSLRVYLPSIRLPRPLPRLTSEIIIMLAAEPYRLALIAPDAVTPHPALTTEMADRHNTLGDREIAILLSSTVSRMSPDVHTREGVNGMVVEVSNCPSTAASAGPGSNADALAVKATFACMARLQPASLRESAVAESPVNQTLVERARKAGGGREGQERVAWDESNGRGRVKVVGARWWEIAG